MARARGGLMVGFVLGLTLVSAVASAEPELVIVASESFEAVDEIDRATLRRLCLGRQTRVNGQRIQFLALAPGSDARTRFNRDVLRMSEDELTRYWIEQALLGGALPPREFEAVDELLEHLRTRASRIAVMLHDREATLPAGLKEISLRR